MAVGVRLAGRTVALKDFLEQINLEIAGLPHQYVKALIPSLKDAERELAQELKAVSGLLKRPYSAGNLAEALYQVRGTMKTIKDMGGDLENELKKAGVKAGNLSLKHLETELRTMGRTQGQRAATIPLAEAAHIRNRQLLLTRYKKYGGKWAKDAVQDIRHQISVGMLKGESMEKIAKRLTGNPLVNNPEDRVAAGLMKRQLSRAERIVRTEVVNAYNIEKKASIVALNKRDPGYLERWVAVIDGRVCGWCRDMDGKTVPAGQHFPDGDPPLHPCCRCGVVAWRKEWPDDE